VDLKLELVLVPVSDVDRAKAFYTEKVGFNLDVDTEPGGGFRIVQMTPPGSACSITIGTGLELAEPGSLRGTHLIVSDSEAARGGASRARRTRRGRQRDLPFRGRWSGAGSRSRAPRFWLVRGLPRPGREHLGLAGGRAPRVGDLSSSESKAPILRVCAAVRSRRQSVDLMRTIL
jgi:catechol 2,3-dioxygenase-like lactoylglutathione lyase family enzyme